MTGKMKPGRNEEKKPSGAKQAAVAGIAFSALAWQSAAAQGAPLAIKGISLDSTHQIVVQFGSRSGVFPSVPHVLDLPGPNHRIVLEFTDATIDKTHLPSARELSEEIKKNFKSLRSIRYSEIANTAKPTARIVLDVSEDVHVKPRVTKLDEGAVTISLGDTTVAPAPLPAGDGSQAESGSNSTPDGKPETKSYAAPASSTILSDARAASMAARGRQDVRLVVAEAALSVAAASAPTPDAATTSSGWDWTNDSNNAKPAAAPQAKPAGKSEQALDDAAEANTSKNRLDAVSAADAADDAAGANAAGLKPAMPSSPDPSMSAPDATADTAPVPSAPAAAAESAPSPGASAPVSEAGAPVPQSDAAPASAAAETPAAAGAPVDAAAAAATPAATAAGAEPDTKSAVAFYNAAVKAHLSGNLTEAIQNYKSALAANPNLAEAYSNLGLIYNQQHNYAQALAEFRKALAINPKDAITYNGIGAALRADKDLMGAIKNWQTAVSLDPHLATAHYNLGTAFELQKDYDRALESYRQAVKNDYRLGEAYYRMGLIMQDKRKFDEACVQFKEALKVSNNSEYSADARQRLAALNGKGQTGR